MLQIPTPIKPVQCEKQLEVSEAPCVQWFRSFSGMIHTSRFSWGPDAGPAAAAWSCTFSLPPLLCARSLTTLRPYWACFCLFLLLVNSKIKWALKIIKFNGGAGTFLAESMLTFCLSTCKRTWWLLRMQVEAPSKWTDFNDDGVPRWKPKWQMLRIRILDTPHPLKICHEVGVSEPDDLHVRMEENSKKKWNSTRPEIPSSQPIS